MAKEGKDNIKIGPWIAKPDHSAEAEQLLYSVMNQRIGEKLWVGVPEANKTSVNILEKNGFTASQQSQNVLRRLQHS